MSKRRKAPGKPKRKSKPRRKGRKHRDGRGGKDWAPQFLAALMRGEHVRDACALCKIDGTLPYSRRVNDEAFGQAWKEAQEIGTAALESEAARRAYHGTLKPVFHKGEECGQIREYSDTLLMFLLRARRPKRYRDNVAHDHAGSIGVHHSYDDMSDAEIDAEIERLESLDTNRPDEPVASEASAGSPQ